MSDHEVAQGEPATWSEGICARLLRNVLLPVALLLVTFLAWQRHTERGAAVERAQTQLDTTLHATGEMLAQRAQHFRTMLETLLAQAATDELLQHWSAEDLQQASQASERIERSCERLIEEQEGVLAIELHGASGKLLLSVSGADEPAKQLNVSAQPWFDAAQRGTKVLTWTQPGTARVACKRTGQHEGDGALIGSLVVDLEQIARPAVALATHAVDGAHLSLQTDSERRALNSTSVGSPDDCLSAMAWIGTYGASLRIEQPLDVALASVGDGGRTLTRAHLLFALVLLATLWIGLQQTVLSPLTSIAGILHAFRHGTQAPPELEHPQDTPLLRPLFALERRVRARLTRSTPPTPGPRFDELSDTERVLRTAVTTIQYGDSVLHAQRTALEQQVRDRDAHLSLQEGNSRASAAAHSRFVADVAGVLRSAIDAARQATGQLLQHVSSPEQGQWTQTAHESTGATLGLLAQLEQLGRLESGQFELQPRECDLYAALEEIMDRVAPCADRKGLEIALEINPDVPRRLVLDSMHLSQLISSLLETMARLTTQGEVVLRVTRGPESGSELALNFEVWGPVGQVNEAALRCALDPFTATAGCLDAPATPTNNPIDDLQLTVCGKLAHEMRGGLSISCNRGQGATLWFSAAFGHPTQVVTRSTPTPVAPIERRRILVVDDSATSLRMLATQLSGYGAIPSLAMNARAAIEMLEASARNEQPFDAALIDLRMPQQDGLALARWIKSNVEFMDLPLALMSGGSAQPSLSPSDIQLLAGMLHKPVREAELLQLMSNIVPAGEAPQAEPLAALPRPAVTPETIIKEWEPDAPASILLAQDEGADQRQIAHILRCLGYGLRIVTTGQDALAAIDSEPFHALLLDRDISDVSAFDVADRIRNRTDLRSCLPIIGLLPDGTPEQRDVCMEAGMDDGIERAVPAKTLGILLKRWVSLCSHLSPAEVADIASRVSPNAAPSAPRS